MDTYKYVDQGVSDDHGIYSVLPRNSPTGKMLKYKVGKPVPVVYKLGHSVGQVSSVEYSIIYPKLPAVVPIPI